jgi:putative ABC transport system ATP-binding protein
MFTIRNLRHRYRSSDVLAVPAWQVAAGEHALLLGPSGSGKTTLLHILAGVLTPSAGEVTVAGQNPAALSPAARDRFRGRTIGLVPQRLHLIASLTVLDNLLLAPYLAGVRQDRAQARALLAELGLADKAAAYPWQLSFGQQQRVAVARAVINAPRLILADEPTSNLDDAHCARTIELLLARARACGATLVVATHDRRVRERFAQRLELAARAGEPE